MSNLNRYIIVFLALLIACMSVAVASDVDDIAIGSDVADAVVSDSTPATDSQVVSKVSEDNNVIKESKTVKQDSNTIIVDNDNFDDYFTSSGLNGVNDGDNISFASDVTRTTNSYVVDKSVNILGNNYTLNLNTISGYNLNTNNPTYIEFNNQSSNSNISYLKFHNTQIYTTTANNVCFDHINVTVSNQGVGKSVGVFSMRNGVVNCTVKNSYFNVANNTGCSIIVITLGENCTIDNNTIIGQGTVGNLIYLNLWGATTNSNGVTQNKGNVISNNLITGPDVASSICMAITIGGPHNDIINNTINYVGTGISTIWAGTYDATTNTTNDYYNTSYIGNGYINNTLNNGASFSAAQHSLVAGNYITGAASIAKNSTVNNNTFSSTATINGYTNFTKNTVNGLLTVSGSHNNISYNNLTDITVPSSSSNNNISYNNFNILTINSDNNIVTYNNYTVSIKDNGDNTLSNNNKITIVPNSNIKLLKGDESNIVYVNNQNLYSYFIYDEYDEGIVVKGSPENTIFYFTENLNKDIKRIIFDVSTEGYNYTITSSPGVIFTKYVSVVGGEVNIVNMTFDLNTGISTGDEEDIRGFFINSGVFCNIENVNLTFTQRKNDAYDGAIMVRGKVNTSIKNSNINSLLYATVINWDESNCPSSYTIHAKGKGSLIIEDCNITAVEQRAFGAYSSIYSIVNEKSNVIIKNNNIVLNGKDWMYNMVFLSGASNNIVLNNNITTNSTNYSASLYLTGANIYDNVISGNFINTTAGYDKERDESIGSPEYVSYGVVLENRAYYGGLHSYGEGNFIKNTISNNTMIGSAYNIYAVEIFGADGSIIENNTVNVDGNTTLGLGAIGANNSFNNNTITVTGQIEEGSTVDYLGAGTTGVLILRSIDSSATNNTITSTFNGVTVQLSNNNTVEYNNITSTEDYSIKIKNSNSTNVTNNYLVAKELKGDESVLDNGTDNLIENNLPKAEPAQPILKVDTTEFTRGTVGTVRAAIYLGDNIMSDVNKGKVTFKVDGKTLKDSNGKVIYAKVTNGVASIENYEIPNTWNENSTIQAVYSGSTGISKLTSEKTAITLTQEETTVTTEDINATKGGVITLKATINAGSMVVNSGKVVFKINGKTVKDANGKVIYAKVVNNTVSLEYTLPDNLKTGDYNITAVFTGSTYGKLEDVKTLTVA